MVLVCQKFNYAILQDKILGLREIFYDTTITYCNPTITYLCLFTLILTERLLIGL